MVLQDMNGTGQKSAAAERWLRQRGVKRTAVVRCIFGPPDNYMAVIERHEAEMDKKRREFVANYEPLGLTPAEKSKFYEGLIRMPSMSASTSHGNRSAADHSSSAKHANAQNKQSHQKQGGQQSSDQDKRN